MQDTYINPKLELFIKFELYFNAYFILYSTNNRDVKILINNNFEPKLNRVKTDKNGNFDIYDMNVKGKQITPVSLYGPKEDNPQFYENIIQKVTEFENEQVFMCGDWNLILNADKEYENYLHINNPRTRQVVLNLLHDDNFKDPWRIRNEEIRKYTWCRLRPTKQQSRLDFYLVRDSIFQYVTHTDIISGYRTDHSAITLRLKLQDSERGKGYWKFNNSLLKDQKYVDEIKKVIQEVKQMYAINMQRENISNKTYCSIYMICCF